jgi:hypothetical protein
MSFLVCVEFAYQIKPVIEFLSFRLRQNPENRIVVHILSSLMRSETIGSVCLFGRAYDWFAVAWLRSAMVHLQRTHPQGNSDLRLNDAHRFCSSLTSLARVSNSNGAPISFTRIESIETLANLNV